MIRLLSSGCKTFVLAMVFIAGFLFLPEFSTIAWGQTTIYTQNFDGAHGWTLDGSAHFSIGAPAAGNTCTSPRSSPNVLGTVLNGTYQDSWTEVNSFAVSPAINCSASNNLLLSFYSYSDFETGWDFGNVYASGDNGVNWVNVEVLSATEGGWTLHTIDISAVAAAKSQVKIKFTMSSDVGDIRTGWNIDDLTITGYSGFAPITYYSNPTGNLNTLATWGTNPDGKGSVPSNFTGNNHIFNIRNNAAPTIVASWTVSGTGSRVTVGDGTNACTFTVGGSYVFTSDCDVSNLGVLKISSTNGTPYSGSLTVNAGGTYEHFKDGGSLPVANWATASTCNVTGVTNTIPSAQNQVFGNFVYNCPGQTAAENFSPTEIAGNLTITDVNGQQLRITSTSLNIGGNFILSDNCRIASNTSRTINVSGNFILNSGILEISSGSGIGTLNVSGDFTMSSGTLTENGSGSGSVVFNKIGTQVFTKTAGTISNHIDFAVNSGSTLNVGTSVIDGSTGTFTLSSGAGIITAHVDGVSTTAGVGSIRVSGTKTYSSGASYTYNGIVNQVTGNGLNQNTPLNLTISNSGVAGGNAVTLSGATTISGNLTLTSGLLTTTTTNLLTITNTASTAISGGLATSFINGPLKWTLPASLSSGATYDFPIGKGTTYLPFELVNPVTGTGTITAQVEVFNANSGGILDPFLASKSTTEYWSLITSVGNFTNSGVSLTRPTAISPSDVIAGSSSLAGTYSNLNGTATVNTISGSDVIGANRFFVFAAKKTITTSAIS